MADYGHKLDAKCPKCGNATLVCEVKDWGAVDFYLYYTHRCKNPNCKHVVDTAETISRSGSPEPDAFSCPMCGHDYSQHFIIS